jgi:hypothetical protein
MADPTPTTPSTGTVCPWCSAAVTPETVICPSCAAVLISDVEPDLPGVTEVDAKILRGEKPPPPRNRLLSWISGDYPDQASSPADAQAVAPPDPEVQREIRRLEYEAEVATLQAEADALLSEAVIEGRVVAVPEGIRPLELDPAAEGQTAATVADEATTEATVIDSTATDSTATDATAADATAAAATAADARPAGATAADAGPADATAADGGAPAKRRRRKA